jgi:hypothetical protein
MPDKVKGEVASSKARDEKGHFIKTSNPEEGKNVLEKFLISHTGNYKNEDDLLDIHIGNPLRRVIELLQDIKKQKAFSFTLKGSLGVAGVVLVLGAFGVFGGGKILCDKGTQTQTGVVKKLKIKEVYTNKVPVLSYFLDIVAPPTKEIKNRTVLVRNDGTVIYLPFNKEIDMQWFVNQQVLATGNYDSCAESLSISDPDGIEMLIVP